MNVPLVETNNADCLYVRGINIIFPISVRKSRKAKNLLVFCYLRIVQILCMRKIRSYYLLLEICIFIFYLHEANLCVFVRHFFSRFIQF